LRIRIPEHGIYELTYDRLGHAGVPVDAIDPTEFQLFADTWQVAPLFADSVPASWQSDYALQELAIWVEGEQDRVFGPDERIVFYALGPYEYLDRVGVTTDSLAHGHNPYDNFNYVWLIWNQARGMRMAEVAVDEVDSTGVVTRTWQRYHFEEDRQFRTADDLWVWGEIRDTRPVLQQFDLDLGGDLAPVAGTLRIGITNSWFGERGQNALIVEFNGQVVGNIGWVQPSTRPPNAYFSFPVQLRSTNELQLSIDTAQLVNRSTLLVSLDVVWERPLVLPGPGAPDGSILRWSRTSDGADEAYELVGFGSNHPVVLDVTDPASPVRLADITALPSAGRWRLRYGRGPGVRTHYAAVRTPVTVAASHLSLRVLPPLRDPAREVPDMLIVTHPTLRVQAERLASHRAAHYPDDLGRAPLIEVVDVTTLYDHFSGGRVDPMAIRNYAKFLYSLGGPLGAPNLRYLLLFGEATRDPRRLLPSTTPTLVPTVHPWYAVRETRREYAVDDWLAEFDAPDPSRALRDVIPLPDVALGRVTPRTEAEARQVVDKFIAYDTSNDYGAWRARLILAADDENTPSRSHEAFHIVNTEKLVGLTPDAWDITKVYLTEFPAEGGVKPKARKTFIREWSTGCALINYQGHGAPRILADERLFLASDIPLLSNGARLPVFMAFSSTVAGFDAPELQSMAEDMLTHPHGGAVATMGATTPTFASANAAYNEQIWREMFVHGASSKVPFGVIHTVAKNKRPQKNNESYVLLGDPSMTLLAPEYSVDLTAGTDTLYVGRHAEIEGIVHLPGDSLALKNFDGHGEVLLLASADTSGYTRASDGFHIDYDLPGVPLLRRQVPVVDGRFLLRFTVPPVGRLEAIALSPDPIRANHPARPVGHPEPPRQRIEFGSKARIRAYAWTDVQDAQGARNNVVFLRSPASATGPADSSVAEPREALDAEMIAALPTRTTLYKNAPNPLNPATTIRFDLAHDAHVELRIYNVSGRLVRTLVNGPLERKRHQVVWDGMDNAGVPVSSGIYFYRLETTDFKDTRKMVVLR
jgi:hypothetical protein